MEREILLLGNPQLYEVSEEVRREELETLMPVFEDLFDCIRGIRRDYGFGRAIAAPQIGILRRFAVCMMQSKEVVELINPTILEASGEDVMKEGCLSCPNKFMPVKRATTVKIRYQDRNGKWIERTFEGFDARVCQHEMDHLDGVLFYDKAVHQDE